jgi:hypothetical protein
VSKPVYVAGLERGVRPIGEVGGDLRWCCRRHRGEPHHQRRDHHHHGVDGEQRQQAAHDYYPRPNGGH